MKWQSVALILLGLLTSTGLVSYSDLYFALNQLTGVDSTYSGDKLCDGLECPAYINVTTTYWRICFDHYNDTKYEDEILFKKVARGRTLHVNLDKVTNIISTSPDVPVDWYVPTIKRYSEHKDDQGYWRLIKGGDCWDRKKINKNKLIGRPENGQVIKWSFVIDSLDIDPLWVSYDKVYERKIIKKEVPIYNYTNVTVKGQVFKNGTVIQAHTYQKKDIIGYEMVDDIVIDKSKGPTIVSGKYRFNKSIVINGKLHTYTTLDKTIFCEDCRCIKDEQEKGLCKVEPLLEKINTLIEKEKEKVITDVKDVVISR